MSFLLFLKEEYRLVDYLINEVGLNLLVNDLTNGGIPRIVKDWRNAIATTFPGPIKPLQSTGPLEYIFWADFIGPVKTLGERKKSFDFADQIEIKISQDIAGEKWKDIIDLSQTPVIRWRRSYWRNEDHTLITPGLLQSMATRIEFYPKALMRIYNHVFNWLKKGGEKINPFEYFDRSSVSEPRNLNVFWVWAWPEAMQWLKKGGQVYPWTG